MSPKLSETYLMITDIERSVAFYCDAVELPLTNRGKSSAHFETEGGTLVIEEDFDPAVLSEFGLSPPGSERGDGVIVAVEVDDVEVAHRQAREWGATVRLEPTEVDWGREITLIEDPDGYVIEVYRPL